MSISTIYRYFASKDELVAAVAEGRDGTVEGDFPAAESPGDILARLLSYVTAPAGMAHAGFDVSPATFQRTLERLLDPFGDGH
jgi:AcrR family transcriptional regulator